jgi:hypothetical protein
MVNRMHEPSAKLLCRVAFKELVVPAAGDTTKLFEIVDEQATDARTAPLKTLGPARTSRDPARRSLARLRACRRAVRALKLQLPLPAEVVFVMASKVPAAGAAADARVRYTMTNHVASGGHRVRASPSLTSYTLGVMRKGSPVVALRGRCETEHGVWVRLAEMPQPSAWWPEPGVDAAPPDAAWMLAVLKQSPPVRYLVAEPAESSGTMDLTDDFFSVWVDRSSPLHLPDFGVDPVATAALQAVPPNWSVECDAQLARLVASQQLARANMSHSDLEGDRLQRFSLLPPQPATMMSPASTLADSTSGTCACEAASGLQWRHSLLALLLASPCVHGVRGVYGMQAWRVHMRMRACVWVVTP